MWSLPVLDNYDRLYLKLWLRAWFRNRRKVKNLGKLDINQHAYRVFSQHREDGILAFLLCVVMKLMLVRSKSDPGVPLLVSQTASVEMETSA